MMQAYVAPQFVEYIPERLDEGILYISEKYGTATHKCCCGCGEEVVTPLNPTDWSLKIEGNLVTLDPSIGNWSFACRSHYWIRRGQVIWAASMTQWQIERVRALDHANKEAYFSAKNQEKVVSAPAPQEASIHTGSPGFFALLWRVLKNLLK